MQFSDPNGKICALKKLAKTAILTVLANFFFGLIFQNPILQRPLVFFVTIKNSLFYLSRQSHVLFYDQFPQYWQFSNHPKILQCFRNCRFLFQRAFRLSGIFRLWLVVVLPFNNAMLLFDLSDVERGNLQASLL